MFIQLCKLRYIIYNNTQGHFVVSWEIMFWKVSLYQLSTLLALDAIELLLFHKTSGSEQCEKEMFIFNYFISTDVLFNFSSNTC